MKVQSVAIQMLAAVTRRAHPWGTDRFLRILHSPDHRRWSIQTTVRMASGVWLHVDTASYLEWRVFFYADYEPPLSRILVRAIRPGHAAIDIGANVGIHALAMARAAANGPVHACEPHPAIYKRLLANVALNSLQNIYAHQVALGDRVGEITLYLPPSSEANQGTASAFRGSQAEAAVQTPCTTLDKLIEYGPVVDFVKIDVEGFEGAVLAGGVRLLHRDHPVLVFEYNQIRWAVSGYELDDVIRTLRQLGYDRFFVPERKEFRRLPELVRGTVNIIATDRAGAVRLGDNF